jgi:SAM-dependent methyltransferase
MKHTCRICGHAGGETFTAREMMFGLRHEFEYFQCAVCRCLQICEIPKDLSQYYPANYYSMQVKLPVATAGRRIVLRLEAAFRHHVANLGHSRRKRISDWMRGTRATRSSAILDVGCGRGRLLHELQLLGFRDLTGADPFVAEELRYAGGIVVHKCELSQLDRQFDIIMMHHTFEHVTDPHATLAAARQRLRPGGFLLVRIPVVDCLAWRQYGVHWFALDAPRHLHLHTEGSMRLLADSHGFAVSRVQWDSGAHQFWGSEQYLRGIPHRSPRSHEDNPRSSIFTTRQLREFERRSRELNATGEGDSACFYLQRR